MYRARSSATIVPYDRDSKLDILASISSVSPVAGISSHKGAAKEHLSYTNGKENSAYKSIKGQCLRFKHKVISCLSSEQSGRNILFTVLLLLVAGLWVLHAQMNRQVRRAAVGWPGSGQPFDHIVVTCCRIMSSLRGPHPTSILGICCPNHLPGQK